MEKKTIKKGPQDGARKGAGGARKGAGRPNRGTESVEIYFTLEDLKVLGSRETIRQQLYAFLDTLVLNQKIALAVELKALGSREAILKKLYDFMDGLLMS